MDAFKIRYSSIDEIIQQRAQLRYDQRFFQGLPSLSEARNSKRSNPISITSSIKNRFNLKFKRSGVPCMLKTASACLSQEEQMQELKLLLEMKIKSRLQTSSPDVSYTSDVDSNYMSLESLSQEIMSGQNSTRFLRTKNQSVQSQPQIPTAFKIKSTNKPKILPNSDNRRPTFKEIPSRYKCLTHRSNTTVMPKVFRKNTLLSSNSFTVTKINTSKACSPLPSKIRSKIRYKAGADTIDPFTEFSTDKQFTDSICTDASIDSIDLTFKNKLLPRFP